VPNSGRRLEEAVQRERLAGEQEDEQKCTAYDLLCSLCNCLAGNTDAAATTKQVHRAALIDYSSFKIEGPLAICIFVIEGDAMQ
jgi:hypothetical protein